MKKVVVGLIALSLSGCGIQSLTSLVQSTYKTFDGKFIDSQLDKPKSDDAQVTNGEVVQPEFSSLVSLRAAADQELVRNPYVEKYLNRLKDKLIVHWPKEVNKEINVVVSSKWNYGAHATNNTVVLSQGVLTDAESEDEIAFILAHELSHILLEHNSTNEYFAKQSVLVDKAANIAMFSASLRDFQSNKVGNKVIVRYESTAETRDKIAEAYKTGATINRLSRDVISSTMNRTLEDEADLLGLDLLVKAGYSARVYQTVMERMQSSETFTKEQLAEKKKELQGFVTLMSDGQEHLKDMDLGSLGYLAANEAATRLINHLSERHQSPEERSEDLMHYVKREYRKERRRKLQTTQFEKELKKGKGRQVIENYWAATEALKALEFGDIKQAEKLARKSVSGATSKDAYTRLAFYKVRMAQNNTSKAIKNLELIKNWDYASIQSFSVAAQAFSINEKYKSAESVLKQGEQTIGTRSPFYPGYIALYKKMGKEKLALEFFEECKVKAKDNIKNQCFISFGQPIPQPSGEKENFFQSIFT